MPAPTNTSFGTATDLGTLPADVTQDVHDAGTTYEVFYKFTAPVTGTVAGAWAFGDLTTYMPTCIPYDSGLAQILSISSDNKPMQFPVSAGLVYYLKITPNAGNPSPASLRVRVEIAPNDAAVAGDVLVGNADIGAPAVVYDPSGDYTIRKFINNFPVSDAGSQACILLNGKVLINVDADSTVRMLDASLTEITQTSYGASGTSSSIAIRGNRVLKRLYFTKDVNPVDVQYYDENGVLDAGVITLTSNNCRALCMDNTAAILYHAGTGFAAAIRRWDVPGNAALSDLAVGIANHFTTDILVTSGGEIIACFCSLLANTCVIRRYNAAGVQQAEYNFDDYAFSAITRLAYDSDNADTHIWVWGHVSSGGGFLSKFARLRLSDGVRVTEFSNAEYDGGVYDYTATASPVARFGNHNCCPFLVFPAAPAPVTPGLYYLTNTGATETVPTPFFKTALIGD